MFHSFIEAKEVHIVEESVEASISFTALSHEASERNGGSLAGHLALLVNLPSTVRHINQTRQKWRLYACAKGAEIF